MDHPKMPKYKIGLTLHSALVNPDFLKDSQSYKIIPVQTGFYLWLLKVQMST